MTSPRYLTRTSTDLWSVGVARDVLANDSFPEAIAWANHTLSLPVTGETIASAERHTDRPSGSGTGNGSGSGSKPTILATEKQISALVKMGASKVIGDATVRHLTATLRVQDIVDRAGDASKIVTKGEASAALDFLFPAPWKPRTTAPAPSARPSAVITEDGMYKLGDRIVKVQKAVHGSGKLYAKELVGDAETGFGFEYTPGLITQLTPADRMTLDEAKAFGQLYGVCCVCSRTLTDETSIAEGIGPICSGRLA